jgi:hypothetical protein
MQAAITDVLAIVPLLLAGVGAELAGARATFAFIGVIGLAVFVLLEGSRLGAVLPAGSRARSEAS